MTYQFLICRTTTLPRSPAMRGQNRIPAFGASAYFILSDGKEASSNVTLSFTDADNADHAVEDVSVAAPDASVARGDWEVPDPDEKILDVVRNQFRIRFNIETWTGRMGAAEVLSGQQLSSLASFTPGAGADYCVWLPGAASSAASESAVYSVIAHDPDGQSATSITFEIKTTTGQHAGALQCFFPRASSAASVAFSRWTSAVGRHLTMEVRP